MRSTLACLLIITLGACSKPPEDQAALGEDVPTETTRVALPTTRPAATQPSDDYGEGLPGRIAAAHGVQTWRQKDALAADIAVEYMSKEVLRAEMIYETNTGRTRLNLEDGATLIWDGEEAWAHPASRATPSQVRFHLRSWPFLMAAPFKFIDETANFEPREDRLMLWQECETGLVTFDPGTGDTPEDWYHIYAQPGTDRLLGMGYLVTYNTESKTREEAEWSKHSNAHSLIFETFEEVDGVVIPSYSRIHRWHKGRPAGDRMGGITLENIRFITPDPDTFVPPPGSKADPLVIGPKPAPPKGWIPSYNGSGKATGSEPAGSPDPPSAPGPSNAPGPPNAPG